MVDIQLTDITTGDVDGSGVFDKLMAAVKGHVTEEFTNGRIKGSDYANVYLGALQGVLSQSIDYVLREKLTEAQIDVLKTDAELKTYELVNIKPKELEIMDKDILIKQKELELRTTESNRMRDTTQAELEKQWGYAVQRNSDNELILGGNTGLGAMDKELELKSKTIELQDYELTELKPAELAIREKELELKTTEADRMKNITEAELEKQWGYEVTRGSNDELVLGSVTGLGALDKEIELKTAQITSISIEHVIKDKEAAALGLDNVVKNREESRKNNANYVYELAYKE